MNKILKRIDDLCHGKGWTYNELAENSDIQANVLYNWKSRDSIPTFPILEKICKGLEITLEQFFFLWCW